MKRFDITSKNGNQCTLYYNSLEEAKRNWNDSEYEIAENNDTGYLTYINWIENHSTAKIGERNSIWIIPYYCGYITYKQYMDTNGVCYDGCEYILHLNGQPKANLLKTLSTPKEFYERFLNLHEPTNKNSEFFSYNEFNRIRPKPKKIYKDWYIDSYGVLYAYESVNKKEIEHWEYWNNYPECLYVCLKVTGGKSDYKWFHNKQELNEHIKSWNTNPMNAEMYYKIIRYGNYSLHPKDRKRIIKFPFIPIKQLLLEDIPMPVIIKNIYNLALKENCSSFSLEIEPVLQKYKEILKQVKNI